MVTTILLARGTDPAARKQSIDTICSWARDTNANIDPDTVQSMREWTEDNAATAVEFPGNDDATLYIHPGETIARDRQGPDDPAAAAVKRAAKEDATNLIIDTLADIDVEHLSWLVTDHNVRVHDAAHGFTVHPAARDRDELPTALRRALEVLAGTAEHADALLAGIEWGGGRPPLGCTSEGGRLAPGEDYDDVCWTLQQVADDRMPKTDAAEALGCTRKTIDNALERRELYRIE